MIYNIERSQRAHLLLALGTSVLALGTPPALSAATPGKPVSIATVSVDFGETDGELLRTERFNTWDNGDPKPELRAGDIAFLNKEGLHADLLRIGISVDPKMCDVQAQTCDFTGVKWIDDASRLTDSLVVHLTPSGLFSEDIKPAETLPLLTLAIRELKKRLPNVDYIEAFNEPEFGGSILLLRRGKEAEVRPEQLYQWYVPFYQAVNTVNRELHPNARIKIGGPTLASFDHEGWMPAFLDGYAADPNPDKRLDFISWHGYGFFAKSDNYQAYNFYKGDPSVVGKERDRIDAMLTARNLTTHIPVFVTETGIYPGPAFDEPDPSKNDWVRQAAGLASLHYWWSQQPNIFPFNWTVRHAGESRKDQLVTLRGAGETSPANTFTPYGNMLLMQSKMKATKVKAVSDSLKAGQGVYAIASKDHTGAALMVWNYQSTNEKRFRATIQMSRLPSELSNGPARRTIFRIDQNTSNYWSDPKLANLQQIDDQVVTLRNSYNEKVDLNPNSIYLITMEPVARDN